MIRLAIDILLSSTSINFLMKYLSVSKMVLSYCDEFSSSLNTNPVEDLLVYPVKAFLGFFQSPM